MLVFKGVNLLLFGVADGAPVRLHEAHALNLYHFLECIQFWQILAFSM